MEKIIFICLCFALILCACACTLNPKTAVVSDMIGKDSIIDAIKTNTCCGLVALIRTVEPTIMNGTESK